ncbi:MAG: FTR1 family protein [Patescibacteria group bacterium]
MFPALLITSRETLEVAIVVGVILTFLAKTDQQVFKKYVWSGAGAGIAISALVAIILEIFFVGFEARTEALFEGILMLVTAGFITWMIMWVHRQKDAVKGIKEKVAYHAGKGYGLGIFFLVAASVFREGTEIVLYLKSSGLAGQSGQFYGAVFGILAAVILGYALFRFALRVNLSLVFNVTSVFLIMFAAGLVAHGVHEFQQLGILPIFSFDPVFNISHILDSKSTIGSFLRTLFGYTSTPTLLELISYSSFIVSVFWLKRVTDSLLLKRAL